MPSVAFALQEWARLPLIRPKAAGVTTLSRLHFRCGLASCHPLDGMVSLRFDAGLSTDAGSQLPGTLVSPRTGLAPAGCPQLVARLGHDDLLGLMASPWGKDRTWRSLSATVAEDTADLHHCAHTELGDRDARRPAISSRWFAWCVPATARRAHSAKRSRHRRWGSWRYSSSRLGCVRACSRGLRIQAADLAVSQPVVTE